MYRKFATFILSLNFLFTRSTCTTETSVTDEIRFIKTPLDSVVELNKRVNFFCQAEGSAMLNVTWKLNGQRLRQSNSRYIISVLLNGLSVLRIDGVKQEDNESEISCSADNDRGHIITSASAKLVVFTHEDLPIGFPTIVDGPKLRAVELGRSAMMNCVVHGMPTPEVTWIKDEFTPVDLNSTGYLNGSQGLWVINEVEDTDEGIYECVAKNSIGVAQSRTAHLYVKTRRTPPQFSIRPESVSKVMLGGSVKLTCMAVGHPLPKVFWRRTNTNEALERPDTAPFGANILTLYNVQKDENFTCVAFNQFGNINSDVTVVVTDPTLSNVSVDQSDEIAVINPEQEVSPSWSSELNIKIAIVVAAILVVSMVACFIIYQLRLKRSKAERDHILRIVKFNQRQAKSTII